MGRRRRGKDPQDTEDFGELAEALGALIAGQGAARFLAGTIIEPTARFFPRGFEPDADGARAVLSRLLRHVGIDPRTIELRAGEPNDELSIWLEDEEEDGGGDDEGGAADERLVFSINHAALAASPPTMTAAQIARETSRAWRRVHGLREEEADVEEALVDVTSVYLGFGVLATNGTHHYEASGQQVGGYAITRWSHSYVGVLGAEAMCLLLGLQIVARRLDRGERKRIGGLLGANQEALYLRHLRHLDGEGEETGGLLARLGITEAMREAAELDEAPTTTAPSFGRDAPMAPMAPLPSAPNAGRDIFVVRDDQRVGYGVRGVLLGALVAGIAGGNGAPLWLCIVLLTAATAQGVYRGRKQVSWLCTDAECREHMDIDSTYCPGCGGRVAGVLRHANDRLAAEERLAEGGDETRGTPYR